MLSSTQKAILDNQRFYSDSDLYNVGGYARITGNLIVDKLQNIIKEVLVTADIFDLVSAELGRPNHQICHDDIKIEYFDFSKQINSEVLCIDWMTKNMKKQFDLSGTLIQIAILKSSYEINYWYVKAHHMVFDGYSMGIFFNKVSNRYEKSLKVNSKIHEEPVGNFKEYVVEEENYKTTMQYWEDTKFWKEQLFKVGEPSGFSTCRKPNIKINNIAKRKQITITRTEFEEIELFSKKYNCSPFHLFITSILILNYYYTGKNLKLGITINNRREKKYKYTLGSFVTVIPFSIDLDEKLFSIELLKSVKDYLTRCYRHLKCSYYDVMNEMSSDKISDLIFDTTVSYQKVTYKSKLGELPVSIHYLAPEKQNNNLIFHFLEYSDVKDLQLIVDYKSDLFEDEIIDEFLVNIKEIFKLIIEEKNLKFRDFDLLSNDQRDRIWTEFNETVDILKNKLSIFELFDFQVRKRQDEIAISFLHTSITYKELDLLSNQMARYLLNVYHVRNNDLVAIDLERSEWTIIAIWSILKSGAGYLPIDSSYPQSRKSYLIEESKCAIVIDQLVIDEFKLSGSRYGTSELNLQVGGSDLAYVIFTSGSTGNPKGVIVEHRNLNSFIFWAVNEYSNSSFDVVYAASSLTFDLSVFEIIFGLCAGKLIRLLNNALEIPIWLINNFRVLLNTVPSVIDMLVNEKISFDNVSVLNIAGEKLRDQTIKSLYDSRIEIRNLYGPTEDTTFSTMCRVSKKEEITIGTPLKGKQVFILNQSNHLLPIGVIGEICLAGTGVTRGYLNSPELTDNKFIKTQFDKAHIYKTGDLGKWNVDGSIQYIGRIDSQVKIRGYRIEPGEIEINLLEHSNVEAAVVLVIKHGDKDLLTAFVVMSFKFQLNKLRSHLRKRLPFYMIPQKIIAIEKLPISSNGKLDRKALEKIDFSDFSMYNLKINKSDPVEVELSSIWSDILNVAEIEYQDDFFELGGHSLKIIGLKNKIFELLNCDISLKVLMKETVFENQVDIIKNSVKTKFENIPNCEKKAFYPISDIQKRIWILSQFGPSNTAYNMAGIFKINGKFELNILRRALGILINTNDILRTSFIQIEDGNIVQKVNDKIADTEIANLIPLKDHFTSLTFIDEMVHADVGKPFDLTLPFLFRCHMISLLNNGFIMTFVLHHIICDAWTVEIFIHKLFSLYSQIKNQGQQPYNISRIQFKDFATWKQNPREVKNRSINKEYWKNKITSKYSLFEFPPFRDRPSIKTYCGEEVSVLLENNIKKKLESVCSGNNVSLFIGVLAMVQIILSRYNNFKDIIVGTPVAGRDHNNFENLFGNFVNIMPFKVALVAENSFIDAIRIVNRDFLDGLDHQEFSLQELLDELNIVRDLTRNPLYDIIVTYTKKSDFDIDEIKQDGVIITRHDIKFSKQCKFDLVFNFIDKNDFLELDLEYNSDIYKREEISRLSRHFTNLVVSAVNNSTLGIGYLKYLNEDEIKLYRKLGQEKSFKVEQRTIEKIFEENVEQYGDRIAIVFEDRQLTYYHINKLSNQFGRFLMKEFGVGIADMVGIMSERSEWIIISVLAVLKIGGVYVPIDIDFPNSKIEFIKTDINSKVIIDRDIINRFFKIKDSFNDKNIDAKVDANNFAYVIYTSGTTGISKGSLISHMSLTNLFKPNNFPFVFKADDIWILIHSFSFDFSVWEMFGALLFGSKLIIASKIIVRDPNVLLEIIENQKVTVLNQTPTFFYKLIDSECRQNRNLNSLRYIFLGAEKLDFIQIKYWRDKYPSVILVNLYGITETTVIISYKFILSGDLFNGKSNIGVPLQNIDCFILDDLMQFQPVGVPGELYIGGKCLGEGYLNNPELTDRNFVNCPWQNDGKLYKSGDIVIQNDNGTMDYLGRKDEQVKIRGYRVELQEIERVLCISPNVRSARVFAKEALGINTLFSFVICDDNFQSTELKENLRLELPFYMHPSHIYLVKYFPITSNGKIDRDEIFRMPCDELIMQDDYIPPENNLERDITIIISKLIGVEFEKIGVNDKFFDLGVNSLQLITIMNEINTSLLLDLKIIDFYQYPSIRELVKNRVYRNKISIKSINTGDEISFAMDEIIDLMN